MLSPPSAVAAAAVASAALTSLSGIDLSAATTAELAECLRELERVSAAHLAARSRVLAAFETSSAYADDGHGTTRSWLRWQTRVSAAAAAEATGWMRRLGQHIAVGEALAAGELSSSWARALCDWTDRLPESAREDADVILLAAAAAGAELADLAALADEMRRRTASPDTDEGDDGFDDRSVRLDLHFRGAGRLEGDLTPRCAAALNAVLDALSKKAGPEDTRTLRQRRHDALEEACRRLVAAGCLPDRAGQPTQIQLTMTLDQLIGLYRDSSADGSGAGPLATAGAGDSCDASVVPLVTGHVDHELLDHLAAMLLPDLGAQHAGDSRGEPDSRPGGQHDGDPPTQRGRGRHDGDPPKQGGRWAGKAQRAARELVLSQAIALLSGPAGLAAYLRRAALSGPAASISLPLDVGAATETIPPHLRRAVIHRDGHCAFPGCQHPPPGCQVHHLRPRSEGGATKLGNLALLCSFHHLIAVHRWGWSVALHADGTVTATSPDRSRVLRSHSPPGTAA